MPTRTFAITADDKPVVLDAKGTGAITITVANTSNRPIRGLTKVVPLGNTKAEWLKVTGEAERNFSAGETHQIVVGMNAPAGTGPGKFTLRLNMMSVQNPDDDFTEGPVVAFEVQQAMPAPAQVPSKSLWWVFVLITLIVIAGVVTVILILPKKVPVPTLVHLTLAEVTNELNKAGLSLFEEAPVVTGTNKPGTVVAQSPEAGAKAKKGAAVTVKLEGEPAMVTVPGVVGNPAAEAMQRLMGAGFNVVPKFGEVPTTDSRNWLHVKEQNPGANASVKPGAQVTLTVWMPQNPTPQVNTNLHLLYMEAIRKTPVKATTRQPFVVAPK